MSFILKFIKLVLSGMINLWINLILAVVMFLVFDFLNAHDPILIDLSLLPFFFILILLFVGKHIFQVRQ